MGWSALIDTLLNVFDHFKEAVFAVKDGEIKYYNDSAAKLIPDIASSKPEDILPLQLLKHTADRYSGEADIAGRHISVMVSTLTEYKIFSMITPQSEEYSETANLLSSVGVELKNMLSVLKMSSGLLLPYIENMGNPRLNRYLATVFHCFYNMLRLTNNLSDFSSILREDMTLVRTCYDVVTACRELLDSVRHFVKESGIELDFKSNEDSLFIYADRVKLERVILNLLANSLSQTRAGNTVTLSVFSAGDRVVISVSDNGAGIPNDVMPTAWNRYQISKETTAPVGIGLGLTIVQNIARLHGGSAVLESKPSGGTTVTVSIPIEKTETTDFRSSMVTYDCNDMQLLLTELSGVIGSENYSQLYMD